MDPLLSSKSSIDLVDWFLLTSRFMLVFILWAHFPGLGLGHGALLFSIGLRLPSCKWRFWGKDLSASHLFGNWSHKHDEESEDMREGRWGRPYSCVTTQVATVRKRVNSHWRPWKEDSTSVVESHSLKHSFPWASSLPCLWAENLSQPEKAPVWVTGTHSSKLSAHVGIKKTGEGHLCDLLLWNLITNY